MKIAEIDVLAIVLTNETWKKYLQKHFRKALQRFGSHNGIVTAHESAFVLPFMPEPVRNAHRGILPLHIQHQLDAPTGEWGFLWGGCG